MSRYEVMLVVDGDLKDVDARLRILNILSLVENLPEYKETVTFSDTLAYPIKKKKKGHRFVINFELDDPEVLVEFNRLALLNKSLLRYLMINENKDKSWRARNNMKKIKDYEIRQEKFRQYIENKKNPSSFSGSQSSLGSDQDRYETESDSDIKSGSHK